MYGIASVPAIWQRAIETIARQTIPNTVVFLDDIVVTGLTEEQHLKNLVTVLNRLQRYNIRINLEKSQFALKEIKYCGYIINKKEISKETQKIEAIQKMPRPRNVSEVRAFIGMINYYARFIRNLSSIIYPLNKLLRKDTSFKWSRECENAFMRAKEAFLEKSLLTHFDPKLSLMLATDASADRGRRCPFTYLCRRHGEGIAVRVANIIGNATKVFTNRQRGVRHNLCNKEISPIPFCKFTLTTDHRPLVQVFAPTKGLPAYSALRMQHYTLFLQGFNYDIKFRKSELHSNADCLSRLAVGREEFERDVVDVYLLDLISTLPVTAATIAMETKSDNELQKLYSALQRGTQIQPSDRFKLDQAEFSLVEDVLRGNRVVIPRSLRTKVLQELHIGHFGAAKMKALARGHCW